LGPRQRGKKSSNRAALLGINGGKAKLLGVNDNKQVLGGAPRTVQTKEGELLPTSGSTTHQGGGKEQEGGRAKKNDLNLRIQSEGGLRKTC